MKMNDKNIRLLRNPLDIENLPIEIVERKGLGHPDSICDGIAENVAIAYCRWCENQIGYPLHHNFDKVQLVAGDVNRSFNSYKFD